MIARRTSSYGAGPPPCARMLSRRKQERHKQKQVARMNELHPPSSIGAIVSRVPQTGWNHKVPPALAHKEVISLREDSDVDVSIRPMVPSI